MSDKTFQLFCFVGNWEDLNICGLAKNLSFLDVFVKLAAILVCLGWLVCPGSVEARPSGENGFECVFAAGDLVLKKTVPKEHPHHQWLVGRGKPASWR